MFIYFFWLNCIISLNYLASLFAKHRAEIYILHPYNALPDILQEKLPCLPKYTPDYLLVLLSFIIYNFKIDIKIQEVNALFRCLSLRPIFVCVTTFPTCMKKIKSPTQIINKIFHSTHDLMFSGHTCVFIFFGRLIGGTSGDIVKYILPITLVQAKQHYTIDVVVAMLVYNTVIHNSFM